MLVEHGTILIYDDYCQIWHYAKILAERKAEKLAALDHAIEGELTKAGVWRPIPSAKSCGAAACGGGGSSLAAPFHDIEKGANSVAKVGEPDESCEL